MTTEQFIRNNKGINDNNDLPIEYLTSLYNNIKKDQIKMDIDINDISSNVLLDFNDSILWDKMVLKSTADQAPAVFTPSVTARLHAVGSYNAIATNNNRNNNTNGNNSNTRNNINNGKYMNSNSSNSCSINNSKINNEIYHDNMNNNNTADTNNHSNKNSNKSSNNATNNSSKIHNFSSCFIHEKDMFLVMAQPMLDAIMSVWEVSSGNT